MRRAWEDEALEHLGAQRAGTDETDTRSLQRPLTVIAPQSAHHTAHRDSKYEQTATQLLEHADSADSLIIAILG